MAKKSRPTFMKRQKEMARQQRQKEKMARRLQVKDRPPGSEGTADPEGEEDPDIAGIRPGPQPVVPEWLDGLPENPVKPDNDL